jgi:hypothetical protein
MKIKILATDYHGLTRTIFFENSHQGTKAPRHTKGYYKKTGILVRCLPAFHRLRVKTSRQARTIAGSALTTHQSPITNHQSPLTNDYFFIIHHSAFSIQHSNLIDGIFPGT